MSETAKNTENSQNNGQAETVEAVRWTQRAVPELTCLRCGYKWLPRNLNRLPKQCPKCLTKLWNKLRTYQLQGKPAPALKRQTEQQKRNAIKSGDK